MQIAQKAIGAGLLLCLLTSSLARAADPPSLETCLSCHGAGGNSLTPLVPSLAGQPVLFLTNQLVYIREGVRQIPAMAGLLDKMSDDELVRLAETLAAMPARKSDENIGTDLVAQGKQLAERARCGSCHLPTLRGQDHMPRLAAQRADYTEQAMKEFRDSTRSGADALMSNAAVGLSDADIKALTQYIASLPP